MTWPTVPDYYDPPKVGHKVILQTPGFPVIYPDPSASQVVSNMRPLHWGTVASMVFAGAALGYWKGSTVHWQKPASIFGAVFFGKSAMLWGMSDTAYRLMGYRENGKEVSSNMPGILAREAY